jgi:hypothetical protein
MTMDNAENNSTMLVHLERRLKACNINFIGASEARIMCFPHVINLCCQSTIKEFTKSEWIDEEDDSSVTYELLEDELLTDIDELSSEEPLPNRDSVARCRAIVRKVKASGMRADHFQNTIVQGNREKWFQNSNKQVVKVPELKLIHDVKTRWDSTFLMVERLQDLHPVSYST